MDMLQILFFLILAAAGVAGIYILVAKPVHGDEDVDSSNPSGSEDEKEENLQHVHRSILRICSDCYNMQYIIVASATRAL